MTAEKTLEDLLKARSYEYELEAEHWSELGKPQTAEDCRAVAVALYEVAACLERAAQGQAA